MTQVATQNGKVWFESNSGNAGVRAIADARLAQTNETSSGGTSTPRQTDTTPKKSPTAVRISAGASIVNAGAASANLAINIANLIARKNTDSTKTSQSLEIEISNESSGAVVVYSVDPSDGDVSKVPQPIGQGSSDIVLITKPTGFDDNDTSIAISLTVKGVDVKLKYSLAGDGGTPEVMQWNVTVSSVDGSADKDKQKFTPGTSLVAMTYVSNDGKTRFSLYTYGITSATGQIELVVYDTNLDASASGSITTNQGKDVNFLDNAQTAAAAATADLDALQAKAEGSSDTGDRPDSEILIAPIISAVFGLASAASNIGNVGFGLAGLFGGSSKQATSDSLELQITNNSSQPLVVYSVTTAQTQDVIGRLPPPLIEGESDVIVMNNPSGFNKDSTAITLNMLVGNVPVALTYTWTSTGSPGRWKVQASANGSAAHDFETALQLFGLAYTLTPGAFRLYTMPVESGTGQIDVTVYDLAPASSS